MKIKIKVKNDSKVVIGNVEVVEELIVDQAKLAPFKTICDNYARLGICSFEVVKEDEKEVIAEATDEGGEKVIAEDVKVIMPKEETSEEKPAKKRRGRRKTK